MTNEEREDAIRFFNEVAEKEVNNAKYSKLAIEALEQKGKSEYEHKQAKSELTREEALDVLIYLTNCEDVNTHHKQALEIAIEALEQQPCDDCISRQAVLNTLDKMDKALDTDRTVENYKELLTECYKDLPLIMPTKKEKTGKWIYKDLKGQFCSACDKQSFWKFDYCPNCGAKMEDKE